MHYSNAARFALAFAISMLAAALAYFGWSLDRVARQMPAILQGVDNSSGTIDAVVEQVKHINQQVPDILKRVDDINEQVPGILAQVDKVQQQIPDILQQVQAVEKNIAPMLAESAALRAELPAILAEVEAVRNTVPSVLDEASAYRELVPSVLDESERIRAMVPPTLSRVEGIVASADQVGKNASEAAVQGFFTGIIKTPFKIAKDISTSMLPDADLSKSDKDAIASALRELIEHPEEGAKTSWYNPKSGKRGEIVLLNIFTKNGLECRSIELLPREIMKGKGPVTLCKDKNNTWQVQN
ncbi:hypothetical protein [Agaribacterium haliotis]|uniref:hypothetical protein n=1 Tax=Agaribacterium haliotis TaxID=2013869 RepID=UPI0011787D1F|nr:hypothetical protein [Agaribacterium haliotis]